MNITFYDPLAFGFFDLLSNSAMGEITLKLYINSKRLVWYVLNPFKVKHHEEIPHGETVNVDTSTTNLK